MPALSLIGNALLAYGPALVLFASFFLHHASLGLLALASAFFALCALLISASLWLLVPGRAELAATASVGQPDPTRPLVPAMLTLVIAVVVQEAVRGVFWLLIRKAEGGILLASESPRSPLHRARLAGAAGYGWALLVALLSHLQPLIESAGPGMRVSPSCRAVPDVFVGSVATVLGFAHQMAWTVVLFHALFLGVPVPGAASGMGGGAAVAAAGSGVLVNRPVLVAYVVVSHLVVSFSSLLQSPSMPGSCAYPLIVSLMLLAVSSVLVVGCVRMSVKKSS
ncbi:Aph-1 protein-domain-containing protein [Catenaria anguillulae PL171]|uniref:Aph-1 protein-domain-containing protein n=1 Tax=Catenaria anguillulae PL171 TaxID=765915 RepID=A0A1Y2HLW8_9FUNG|nr:Aph-1 protein-domain-containing protein [Catenaria anguillulae PL171]